MASRVSASGLFHLQAHVKTTQDPDLAYTRQLSVLPEPGAARLLRAVQTRASTRIRGPPWPVSLGWQRLRHAAGTGQGCALRLHPVPGRSPVSGRPASLSVRRPAAPPEDLSRTRLPARKPDRTAPSGGRSAHAAG